jgi:hypothetical protein
MAYKNPEKDRDYRREYQLQKARGEHEDRMERQRARNEFDKKNGRSARKGKDLAHRKPLARGGSNSDGVALQSPSKNRAAGGRMSKPTKRR